MAKNNFIIQLDDVSNKEIKAIILAELLGNDFKLVRSKLANLENVDLIDKEKYTPVGTVEFCRKWMELSNIKEPSVLDYFNNIHDFFNRKISIYSSYNDAPVGSFIKPVQTKLWDPHIKISTKPSAFLDLVIASEVVDFVAEWRVYVLDKKIVGVGRYDFSDAEIDFDLSVAKKMVDNFSNQPCSYALDLGLTDKGDFSLVEFTDAWAIGLYKGGPGPLVYAEMLSKRWEEIVLKYKKQLKNLKGVF
jgi:hypothetical protein